MLVSTAVFFRSTTKPLPWLNLRIKQAINLQNGTSLECRDPRFQESTTNNEQIKIQTLCPAICRTPERRGSVSLAPPVEATKPRSDSRTNG